MTADQIFHNYYALLYSIAFKFVQSKEDAEDIVQDTFYNWLNREQKEVANTKAYLVKCVKNACINFLDNLNKKKAETLHEWSNQLCEYQYSIGLAYHDIEKELSSVWSSMMQKLTPIEQAVFVLKNSFDLSYDHITEVVDTKVDHARKIFQRAKYRMQEKNTKFKRPDYAPKDGLNEFMQAHVHDDLAGYINHLRQSLSDWIEQKQQLTGKAN